MPTNTSIPKSAVLIAFLDTLVALLAGMAIFPLAMANQLEVGSGPGLMFVTLPLAFAQMPGGAWMGALFFGLVAIAALSSAISILEPAVAWLERRGVSRLWSAASLTLVAWLGSIACIYREAVFNNLDAITTQYTLPLGGLLSAIFVGWVMKRNHLRKTLNPLSETAFNLFYVTLRFLTPAGIIIVMLNSLNLL